MIQEFKAFIMRGNVFDLAIGVIIGGAFNGLVKSFTNNLISPIIGFFTGKVNFNSMKWSPLPGLDFQYGAVLTDLINFLITGIVIFLMIKFINRVFNNNKQQEITVKPELELLTDIRDLLKEQQTSK